MRRAVLLGTTMVIMALLAVGIASADPLNSKNALFLTFDCGGEEVQAVSIFNNRAIVANVVDDTSNFVGTRFEGTLTFTDPETGLTVVEPFDDPIGQGKRTGQQGELTACATTIFFEDPVVGTVRVDVTVTGFFTPRGA
jgi:hypothetical protein